jgi:hypothetical protein
MSIVIILLFISVGGTIFIKSKASFKLPQDKNILILGDSHTEFAIDDNILPRSINVSQGATAYLYTYCELKKFLDENSHIDTLLLSFHYNILTKGAEDLWLFKDEFITNKIPKYFTLMGKDEFLIYLNNEAFIKSTLQIPIINVRAILRFFRVGSISYTDLYIGEKGRLDRNKLQEDINRRNKVSKSQQSEILSEHQRNYLLKIVELCKTKQVELILINTPIYDAQKYGSTDKLNNFYDTYLKGTKYWDYSGYPLPDSYYGDIEHLNYKGAEIFSSYLRDSLQSQAIIH